MTKTITFTPSVETVLTDIEDAELSLLKGPLLADAQALQAPGVNILSAQNTLANLAFQLPQLNAPAQAAFINIIGGALAAWINEIPAPSAAASSTSGSGSGGAQQ